MFAEVSCASAPGSAGRPNEDLVIAGPSWAVVLDGATAPAGVDSGCAHDVPWLVARLGGALAARLSAGPRTGTPLTGVLEEAIAATMGAHGSGCDLGNPDSPSATVALARVAGGRLEYLVLGDSPVLLATAGGGVRVVADDRLERLPGGRPYSLELVRSLRNTPEGFWVAAARPEAARQAVTGSVPLRELRAAGLCTDGVTRLVDRYGWSWDTLAAELESRGPRAVIDEVRALEAGSGVVRGKLHDDATAVWARVTVP
ncbi:protein phosphatase 2C domain-containing protein [Actinomadura sp. ATCC 31491]|uniref:Protein phosphatase 2C domain-containing protein n=1 Tax=Actinomadura luzonensis TaxID=2805427 RepID=A0ABT0G3Y1_9ACTN|nr:protein phosphatase 2C domain-containing protein [Actinomadura luzonensis]MCK2219302.1 protein phosphatase 2C domain-containing protein [Actinomadura luzonensis]